MFVRTAAFLAAAGLLAGRVAAQSVVAHFIVGVAGSFQQSDWESNMVDARAVGIDGFALDVGNDATLTTQVPLAYAAAEAVGFKVFLQFDYAAYDGWTVEQVSSLISQYASSPAQFKVGTQPLVSTFEGPAAWQQWPTIKSNTGCFFAPDWTSAKGTTSDFAVVDGALSWDIWPTGAQPMTDAIDVAWQGILGASKTYIMGISPWFYTNLPTYSKNWIARGSGLWHQRWQDAVAVKPQMVEIVTWNDFGESHYIGPNTCTACYPTGSEAYVQNNPHDGWRLLLPAYINEYKTGNSSSGPTTYNETLVYAHSPNPTTPTAGCADGGTTSQFTNLPAEQIAVDAVDVYVLLNSPAEVKVTIGGQTSTYTASFAGVNFFAVPTNGQTGPITYSVSRNGQQIMGGTESPGISTDCSANNGLINYNAVVGSYSSS